MVGARIVYYCLECDFSEEQPSNKTRVCTYGSFLIHGQYGKTIDPKHFIEPAEGEDNRPKWCPI